MSGMTTTINGQDIPVGIAYGYAFQVERFYTDDTRPNRQFGPIDARTSIGMPWFRDIRNAIVWLNKCPFQGEILAKVLEADGSKPSWVTAGVYYQKDSGHRNAFLTEDEIASIPNPGAFGGIVNPGTQPPVEMVKRLIAEVERLSGLSRKGINDMEDPDELLAEDEKLEAVDRLLQDAKTAFGLSRNSPFGRPVAAHTDLMGNPLPGQIYDPMMAKPDTSGIPVLYDLDENGEGTGTVYRFCNDECADKFDMNLLPPNDQFARSKWGREDGPGMDEEACTQCGETIPDPTGGPAPR